MLASFPLTLARAVCVTVVCECARFGGGRVLIGVGSAGLGDRGAHHFASVLNVGVGTAHETQRHERVCRFLDASGDRTEDAGRGVRRQGMEGLGFAANGVSSDGLLAFSDALKGWKERGESDLMLRRLDVRENELGPKVALAFKKVPLCSAPPCARVVFV